MGNYDFLSTALHAGAASTVNELACLVKIQRSQSASTVNARAIKDRLKALSAILDPIKMRNQPGHVTFTVARVLATARYLTESYLHNRDGAAAPTAPNLATTDYPAYSTPAFTTLALLHQTAAAAGPGPNGAGHGGGGGGGTGGGAGGGNGATPPTP